ncbi:hypothetical protein ACFE04_018876 [Oxalis oulophora]
MSGNSRKKIGAEQDLPRGEQILPTHLWGPSSKCLDLKAPAEKLYNIWRKDPHVMPNISPDILQGVEHHDGRWDDYDHGSHKTWNYTHGQKYNQISKKRINDDDVGWAEARGGFWAKGGARLLGKGRDTASGQREGHESLSIAVAGASITTSPIEDGTRLLICTRRGARGRNGKSWSEEDGEPRVAKEVIEAVDVENNSITYRVIEGDLMKEYKNFLLTIQVTPKGTGSNVHWILEYEKISEEVAHPETLAQFVREVSEDLDKHLAPEE